MTADLLSALRARRDPLSDQAADELERLTRPGEYSDLIARLYKNDAKDYTSKQDAADAIETLTAERDAAVRDAERWHDRAVQVIANTGEPVGFSTRGLQWQPIEAATDESAAPWDGIPVLICTNHRHWPRVHRARWTDDVHGGAIFGWAVDDCKHGPYSLRGYTMVTHWMPLPNPPEPTP